MDKCPYCNSENIVWLNREKKFKCNNCGVHFSIKNSKENGGNNE